MLLTKDAILAADDLPRELVHVPEWGGDVYVRTMRANERDQLVVGHHKDQTFEFHSRLIAATVCDEAGELLFTEADLPAIARKSAAALDRVLKVAARLSGLTDKDIDDLEKNSEATPPESSPSSSPDTSAA